jgi:steroid 5-alpha reductase family enzyme
MVVQGWLYVALTMLAVWAVATARRDASIVDVAWTYCLGFLAVYYALHGPGDPQRRALVGVLGACWSLRLGTYLFFNRIYKKPEDGRYQTLRRQWAGHVNRSFLIFFQLQGLADVLFSLTFWVIAHDPRPTLSWSCWLGVLVWTVAIVGEATADAQLAAYRANPAHRGLTCRAGLWRYSRHPNYFFEWLHWCSYIALGWGAPHAALTWVTPAVLLYLLFRVTGIPATEAQAVASRGDDYREYQRTTSAFVPWFTRA